MQSSRLPDNYRLQIVTKTKNFRWWNVFKNMCCMGMWSFLSWFHVNRSTYDEDVREKQFIHFRSKWPSDLDIWPLDLRFAPLVTVVQRYIFNELDVSTASYFGGTGRTDRRTDRVQHLLQPPVESHITSYYVTIILREAWAKNRGLRPLAP